MNCLKIFYPLQKYSSVTLYPASSLGSTSEVYSNFMSFRLPGSLPVNRNATWYWNYPRTRPMRGVTTRVSSPKDSTDHKMALKKICIPTALPTSCP